MIQFEKFSPARGENAYAFLNASKDTGTGSRTSLRHDAKWPHHY